MQMIEMPGRTETRPQAESVPAVGLGDDAEAVVAAVDVDAAGIRQYQYQARAGVAIGWSAHRHALT